MPSKIDGACESQQMHHAMKLLETERVGWTDLIKPWANNGTHWAHHNIVFLKPTIYHSTETTEITFRRLDLLFRYTLSEFHKRCHPGGQQITPERIWHTAQLRRERPQLACIKSEVRLTEFFLINATLEALNLVSLVLKMHDGV